VCTDDGRLETDLRRTQRQPRNARRATLQVSMETTNTENSQWQHSHVEGDNSTNVSSLGKQISTPTMQSLKKYYTKAKQETGHVFCIITKLLNVDT